MDIKEYLRCLAGEAEDTVGLLSSRTPEKEWIKQG